MYLIFDTETTGFPKDRNAPISQLDNWPRVVQLSWQIHDKLGKLIENYDYIIKPEGYTIPFNASQIHGISTQKAQEEGEDLAKVLESFKESLQKSKFIVGHNIVGFDVPILASEFFRKGIEVDLLKHNAIDTITEGTKYCALPGGRGGGFKFPKLGELYYKLFNENFSEAHNAAADVNANARVFFEMLRLQVIPPEKAGFTKEEFQKYSTENPNKIGAFKIKIREQADKITNSELRITNENVENNIDTKHRNSESVIHNSEFFHFHTHSTFSILQSTIQIKNLVQTAIKENMPAVGITDFGNLMGAFQFINEVSKANDELKKEAKSPILPIIGCEVFISEDYLKNKFTKDYKDIRYTQVLLAKNFDGYKNLSKISTIGYTKGLYSGFPRVGKEIIIEYKENLIATTGSLSSEIPSLILNQGEDKAETAFIWWKEHFGEDFYVEIQNHNLEEEQHVNEVLIGFAKKYKVKILAQNEAYYLKQEEADSQDILVCIKDGEKISVPKGRGFGTRYGLQNREYYYKNTTQISQIFKEIPESISNFSDFLTKFEPYVLKREVLLPKFDIPKEFIDENDAKDGGNRGENAYLKNLTFEGAKKRYKTITTEITERLNFELETIAKTGYPGYFLIVQDFTAEARKMGVVVGPGRGSAAGSAVAYCTGITNVDPIKYDLLFERFLNPDRVSLPDIDIDFDDRGRDKIINWVVNKYGQNQVAQIITYGTLAGRSAVRDAGRVLELPLYETDKLSKYIPATLNLNKIKNKDEKTLQKEVKSDEIEGVLKIKSLESEDSLAGTVIQNATLIEGSVRNTGVHACGIIITPEDITNLIPITVSKESDLLVSQFDNSVVESAGLLKMDFLGLRTLTIIKDAIEIIKEKHAIEINPDEIDLDDELTYEKIFKEGNTIGIFQYESAGMQKHLKALKPDKFDDLIAMNALYRPGPIAYIPNFIARKNGQEKITFDLPVMEEFLKDTYGITVYQEQVMLLSQKIANFSKGQADNLRKAMGKKIRSVLDGMWPQFLEGGLKNGHPEEILSKIWKDWEAFAEYAFNKSHSTCYAIVAFQTAYLKAHYPAEYMAALLTNNLSQLKTITFFMDECKRMGIKVLAPDVNESKFQFFVNNQGGIRFGMGAIKGIGHNAVESIVAEREKNGKFLNIFDFFERIDLRSVTKKTAESLAYSGAFDELDTYHRGQYFWEDNGSTVIENLLKYGANFQENKNNSQNSLFGDLADGFETLKPTIPESPEWNILQKLAKEKEMVGVYISSHPLDEYKYEIQKLNAIDLNELDSNKEKYIGRELNVFGMISKVDHKTSQDGRKQFGIFELEDYTGTMNFRIFGDYYLKVKYLLVENYFVCAKVLIKKSPDGNNIYVNINYLGMLKDVIKSINQLVISVNINDFKQEEFNKLNNYVEEFKGDKTLLLELIEPKEKLSLRMNSSSYKINICKELLDKLAEIKGLKFRLN